MTRLFLAAGVAALALAVPAGAKPGGNGGGHGDHSDRASASVQVRGGGGGHGNGGGFQARGGGNAQVRSFERHGGGFQARGGGNAEVRSFERHGGGFNAMRAQRFAAFDRGHGKGNASVQVERGRGHASMNTQRFERQQARGRDQIRSNHFERVQNRQALREQFRGKQMERVQNRQALREQVRGNQGERFQNREALREQFRGERLARNENFGANARGYGIGGCPPGLESKGCMPPGQAAKLLGQPVASASRIAALSSLPLSARYLYPDTNDYYYQYGDGYLYRVNRQNSLIDSLLPLAFGGYMPGTYFPSSYMNSNYYVPDYYGFNSFYPDSPYSCNRYVNGVIYQVDCMTGMIQDVVPLYASGYGVGQLLPTGYGYYNVPYQYRDMYYDTSDYGYWYAPGAIYQYDPSSSMITSVAALLSPGFNIGQPLPMGYDAYNVPYAYRSTYYDTPSAMYRYNNGYIYQVDPVTQLVTAIVASILT
jgi:hypothetical protein